MKIIPVKRLNSLLVVTPRAHYLDTVSTWVQRLDAAPDANFARKLYVYPVQNTTASRLADLLTRIYSGNGRSDGSSNKQKSIGSDYSSTAPGMQMESIGSSSSKSSRSSVDTGFANTADTAASAVSSTVEGLGGDHLGDVEEVRVVADDENNALMIYASGKQYDLIASALEQLDVVATQVVIEASILEVTLTEELRYGLEWSFNGGLGSKYTGNGTLDFNNGTPSSLFPGFSYAISRSPGDIRAVLNALSQDSLVNVISTPSVMVQDNNNAYIHVGDQVQVQQGSAIN